MMTIDRFGLSVCPLSPWERVGVRRGCMMFFLKYQLTAEYAEVQFHKPYSASSANSAVQPFKAVCSYASAITR